MCGEMCAVRTVNRTLEGLDVRMTAKTIVGQGSR